MASLRNNPFNHWHSISIKDKNMGRSTLKQQLKHHKSQNKEEPVKSASKHKKLNVVEPKVEDDKITPAVVPKPILKKIDDGSDEYQSSSLSKKGFENCKS